MKAETSYEQAHLLVAAIRVLTHQHGTPPTVADVCRLMSISREEGHRICNKLVDMGAVQMVAQVDEPRMAIRDHLKIEEIPRDKGEDPMARELEKFRAAQKGLAERIESIKASQAEKKKSLFADLEKKLKKKKPAEPNR